MLDHSDTLYASRVTDAYGLFAAVKTFEGVRSQAHLLIKQTKGDPSSSADLCAAVDQLRTAQRAAHQLVCERVLPAELADRFMSVAPPLADDAGLFTVRTACALALAFLAGVVESDGFVATSVLAARSTREALGGADAVSPAAAALTAGGNYL